MNDMVITREIEIGRSSHENRRVAFRGCKLYQDGDSTSTVFLVVDFYGGDGSSEEAFRILHLHFLLLPRQLLEDLNHVGIVEYIEYVYITDRLGCLSTT